MKKLKTLTIMPIIALALTATACSSNEPVATTEEVVVEEATPVEVTKVALGTIKNEISYVGTIKAESEVQILAPLTAKVTSTYYDIGDSVNEGATLFTLDREAVEDQIRQLESQLNISTAAVNSAQNSSNSVTGGQYQASLVQQETAIANTEAQLETIQGSIDMAQAAYGVSQSAYDMALTNYNNAKILYDNGTMSKIELDQSKMQLEQAQVSLEQAQVSLDQAKSSLVTTTNSLQQLKDTYSLTTGQIAKENKTSANLGVQQAQAQRDSVATQLEIARKTLDDTNVTAPISGVVSYKGVYVNGMATPSAPAYTIVNTNNVTIEAKVSEKAIAAINKGDAVDINIAALGQPFVGHISAVAPAADQTGTFQVKITVNNQDGKIKPGMFAELSFIIDESNNTVVLPRNTVMQSDDGYYVYIAQNDRAVKVPVTVGIDNGAEIEVLTGLKQGDNVVTKGQSYLSSDELIKIVN